MKRWAFLLIGLLVWGCQQSPYPGYSKVSDDVYYQLLKFGEATEKAKQNDYITADIVYQTLDDSVFFKGRRKIRVESPETHGKINKCFMMLAEGEQANFIIPANDFFEKTLQTNKPAFLEGEEKMKVNVEILELQTSYDYLKEKEAFLRWIEDFGEYEKVLMKQFIQEEDIQVEPYPSGIYHIQLAKGNGVNVEVGDTVTVHFEGKFLNGKFFDSTKRRNQPFQFVYGRKWQVIDGLEDAIGHMTEGEHALFIIPSEQGFGETGSSTGIVPPYTSTIFDVELIDVGKAKNRSDKKELNKYDEKEN
jgi:FKBP-type peptidyl-prolyl cis-trans isomerase